MEGVELIGWLGGSDDEVVEEIDGGWVVEGEHHFEGLAWVIVTYLHAETEDWHFRGVVTRKREAYVAQLIGELIWEGKKLGGDVRDEGKSDLVWVRYVWQAQICCEGLKSADYATVKKKITIKKCAYVGVFIIFIFEAYFSDEGRIIFEFKW